MPSANKLSTSILFQVVRNENKKRLDYSETRLLRRLLARFLPEGRLKLMALRIVESERSLQESV